jgi:hypothetical protein
VAYEVSPREFLLHLPRIARYLVSDGQEIVIERQPASRDEDIHLFLFGSVFGALLHQRGVLPVHGSAIATDHGAVIFTGPSGHGKSTLAAAFQQRGYAVLADDVCAVACDANAAPQVFPAYPQLALWADAAQQLRTDVTPLRRVRGNVDKYAVPLEQGFATRPLPLYAVYELGTTNLETFTLTPIQGREKLELLIHNTYRKRYLKGMGRAAANLQHCTAAARHIKIRRVIRPHHPFLLDALTDLLEKDLTCMAASSGWLPTPNPGIPGCGHF